MHMKLQKCISLYFSLSSLLLSSLRNKKNYHVQRALPDILDGSQFSLIYFECYYPILRFKHPGKSRLLVGFKKNFI